MIKIIDISYWQTPSRIDYDLLAADIDGAIVRATYGTNKDTAFLTHTSELIARGVPVGAYGFITEYHDPLAQAQAFSEQVKALGDPLPMGQWADVENAVSYTHLTLPTN